MNRRFMLRLGIRALLAWLAVCVVVFAIQRPLTVLLLPFFEVIVSLLQQDFTATLKLVEDNGQAAIEMSPFLRRPLQITEQVALRPLVTLPPLRVSVDHSLVPLVLMLAGVAGWPFASRREAAMRGLLAIGVLPLVLALSTPVLLVGNQQVIFFEAALRRGAGFHEPGLVTLMIFMETGGRWLLPLAAAIACVVVAHRSCFEPVAPSPPNSRTSVPEESVRVFPPV